jgi:hypothetical protein
MLLCEWKYVESYSRTNIRYRNDRTDRYQTYAPFLEVDDSPFILSKLQSIDDLFYEPIYQAVRHILMANEIKKHHAEIDEVIVLHLRSERNQFLLENPSPGLIQGETVYDAIRAVMREPGSLVDVGYGSLLNLNLHNAKNVDYPVGYIKCRYGI